jgi:hypothetical protein
MFLITPLQSAAVIAVNCVAAKAYVTLRYRWYEANRILGNWWRKLYILPDNSGIKELTDGHLKQDPTWKGVRATQLNESEWTALCLPVCLYFASTNLDAGLACSLTAWSQVGYTLVRTHAGYPYHMPFAVLRFAGTVLCVKALYDTAFGNA